MFRNKFNLRKVVAIAICLAGTTVLSGCGNENDDGSNDGKEFLTCDKIHSSASTFTTLNVQAFDLQIGGRTNADYLKSDTRLSFIANTIVDGTSKSFIVAESEYKSENLILTFKDAPNGYLAELISDAYDLNAKKIEGRKTIYALSEQWYSETDFENLNISNKNIKTTKIYYGWIFISPKTTPWHGDFYATMGLANIDCDSGGWFVYCDSNCEITGYIPKYSGSSEMININILLRKGWNKVFNLGDRIITTDNIKDSHLYWYSYAG